VVHEIVVDWPTVIDEGEAETPVIVWQAVTLTVVWRLTGGQPDCPVAVSE
jgi:hypothetical protein